MEVAATRGVVGSVLTMLEGGATHVGVATDHVVESFRNDLYDGYKTSAGMDPELLAQFPVLEDALRGAGRRRVGDGGASRPTTASPRGARVADADPRVERAIICTPDKDLGQCVGGDRVVQLDRRKRDDPRRGRRASRSSASVPASIPDYLALVGDTRRRLPRHPGMGREVHGDRARALRAPRGDPGAREGLGRRRARVR